ncbi:MAG: hypothetical protein WBE37_21235 [Bryobacteraceae bacterium]
MRSPSFLAAGAMLRTAMARGHSTRARQSYQNGVPFLVRNFYTFGIFLSDDVFDFGKHRAAVRERETVVELRAEGERIAGSQLTRGTGLVSARRRAPAAGYKARAELRQAQLAHLPAWAERERTIGRTTAR